MTRTNEAKLEARQDRRASRLSAACDQGLLDSVSRAGGELVGFSVKLTEADCLLTLRALFPSGAVVAFVGGETLGGCILKAVREAAAGELRWREDQYAKR